MLGEKTPGANGFHNNRNNSTVREGCHAAQVVSVPFRVCGAHVFTRLVHIIVVVSLLLANTGSALGATVRPDASVQSAMWLSRIATQTQSFDFPEAIAAEAPASASKQLARALIAVRQYGQPAEEAHPPIGWQDAAQHTPLPSMNVALEKTPTDPAPMPTPFATPTGLEIGTREVTSQVVSLDSANWVLNGGASTLSETILLTEDYGGQYGSAWNSEQIDLAVDFDKSFVVYLGDRNENGADGIVFVLQNQGVSALGGPGHRLAYSGTVPTQNVTPSIGVEIDTFCNNVGPVYDPYPCYNFAPHDHLSIVRNGSTAHQANPTVFFASEIEDGVEHLLDVKWLAAEHQLEISFDGELMLTYSEDIVSTIFGGDSTVWYGFTGATGTQMNLQYFYETFETSLPPRSGLGPGCGNGSGSGGGSGGGGGGGGGGECEEEGDAYVATQGGAGGSINTRTGGLDYSFTDLSVQTSAGPLSFRRWYSTLATDIYTSTLGYGWAHSLDTRLIFPDDPGGESGYVFFKARTLNQYTFTIEEDGTYSAYPGLEDTLIRSTVPVTTYLVTTPSQWKYIFDADGRLTRRSDPQGNSLHYEYSTGRLTRVVDDTGQRYLQLEYDISGRIETVRDHTSRQVHFTYDEQTGDLVSASDVLSTEVSPKYWRYDYSDPLHPHFMTAVYDPLQHIVERAEYEQGRAVRQYNGVGELIVELTFNGDGTTTLENGLGRSYTHTYDDRGILTVVSGPLELQIEKAYGLNFYPTVSTNALDNSTRTTWDEAGNLIRVSEPLTVTRTMAYDKLNNLTSIVDGRGVTTNYIYSGSLLIEAQMPGSVYHYGYTSSNGNVPPGRLRTVEDPQGNLTWFGYDEFGQRVVMTDTLGRETFYSYDDLGRLYRVEQPNGRADYTCFDDAGRVIRTVADSHGQGDPCNPAAFFPDPDPVFNQITETIYDDAGNVIAFIDNRGLVTRTYYDDANRPRYVVRNLQNWAIENPEPPLTEIGLDYNLTHETVYDANSNVIASVEWFRVGSDIRNRITRTYYDDLDRPYLVVVNLAGRDIFAAPPTPEECNQGEVDQNVCSWTTYDVLGNVVQTRNDAGQITRSCYDDLNRAVKTIQNPTVENPCAPYAPGSATDQDVINQTVYDQNGNPIATIDPLGMVTRTYYDDQNRPYLVIRNLTVQQYLVDDPPEETEFGDVENVATGTYYDSIGNAIATKQWLAYNQGVRDYLTRTYYDDLNRPYLVVRHMSYQPYWIDTHPPLSAFQNNANVATGTVFDDDGRAIASREWLVVDGALITHTTRTYFDEHERAIAVVRNLQPSWDVFANEWPDFDPQFPDRNVRSESVYDEDGRQIASIQVLGESDAEQIVNRTYYDSLGRTVTTIRNLVLRDGYGNRIPIAQAIAVETPPVYNPVYPDENIRNDTVYDGQGLVIANISWVAQGGDAVAATIRTYYDELNRSVEVIRGLEPGWDIYRPDAPPCNRASADPVNICTETIYDAYGRGIATIDPMGVATRTYFDALGRTIATVRNLTGDWLATTWPNYVTAIPDANLRREREYDRGGRLIISTEVMSETEAIDTRFEYDDLGRLTAVVENYVPGASANGETNVRTEYAYNALGNRLSIRDARMALTTFNYDPLGNLVDETDQLGNFWGYQYYASGQRAEILDANSDLTWLRYDGLGRLAQTDIADPDEHDTWYAYNSLGWRTAMTDGVGVTRWEYNALGQAITVTDPFSGSVMYTYDAQGNNRTSLSYPSGETITYTYDILNRLVSAGNDAAGYTAYSYLPSGFLNQTALPNGVNTHYSYDDLGRILELSHTRTTETLAVYRYGYDAAGNRILAEEFVAGLPASGRHFEDDMENGDSPWTHTANWELIEGGAHSPTHSWAFNAYNSWVGSGNYRLEMITPVEIPNNALSPALTFTSRGEYIGAIVYVVEISDDSGSSWDRFDLDNLPVEWTQLEVDLSGYRGKAIRVRFSVLASDGSYSSWWIDDVVIESQSPQPGAGFVRRIYAWGRAQAERMLRLLAGLMTPPPLAALHSEEVAPSSDGGRFDGKRRAVSQYPNPQPMQSLNHQPNYQLLSDLIFSDGFETGDFRAWVMPVESDDLSVTTQAALHGTYGMQVVVNDTGGLYVQDNTPVAEKHHRARLYFDGERRVEVLGVV